MDVAHVVVVIEFDAHHTVFYDEGDIFEDDVLVIVLEDLQKLLLSLFISALKQFVAQLE